MFYQISNNLTPITLKEYDNSMLTFGIIPLSELEACYQLFGFSHETVLECNSITKQMHGVFGVYSDYHFGIITGIDSKYFIHIDQRIGIYIKENLFLIVIIEDTENKIQEFVKESLKQINYSKFSIEQLIFVFLEKLIHNDYALLEKIENQISRLEDKIDTNKLSKNFNLEITKIRKRLLLLSSYYEQLIMIGEELEDNYIGIFNDSHLRYFKLFTDRVTRLSNNSRMLLDFCTHVGDSYRARLDYNSNNTMKLFTVITTIFLPLTLIVGWYGMNFQMPELNWKYGYLYVFSISALVVIACIIFFKKKKLL